MAVLTTRENQILSLIISGNSSTKISDLLCISKRTVDAHRRNIIRKTGERSQIGFYKYAVANNLINSSINNNGSTNILAGKICLMPSRSLNSLKGRHTHSLTAGSSGVGSFRKTRVRLELRKCQIF
jgi:DNA-binding CsgD family transcriptional regulator